MYETHIGLSEVWIGSNDQNHRGEINLLFKILLESALHSDTEMCLGNVHHLFILGS